MTNVGSNVPYAKDGANWKQWSEFYVNVNGQWKTASSVHVRKGSGWEEVWNHAPIAGSLTASDTTQTPFFLDGGVSSYGRSTAQLNITGSLSGSYTEIFYLYRKDGINTYTESLNGSLSNLEYGGNSGVTYRYKPVGYNGRRRITVSGTVNRNGNETLYGLFPITQIELQYNNTNNFSSYTAVSIEINSPDGSGNYSYATTFTIPTLARGAVDTWSTVYYRVKFTNAAGVTYSSVQTISPQVKYSPSNYATIGTGESSFTTYRYRQDTYSTVGSHTWSFSPPSGGVAVDVIYVTAVGGGGGGGKATALLGGAGGAGGGAGGERRYKEILVNGNSATVVVGGGGQGGGAFGTDGWNGNNGSPSSLTVNVFAGDSVSAAAGTGGQSSASYSQPYGGSSYNSFYGYRSGGAGYYSYLFGTYEASIGGGGAGGEMSGGSASSTSAGNGGGGYDYSPQTSGGGGGAGVYLQGNSDQYGNFYVTHVYVSGVGAANGGNGNGNGAGANATGYGGGGGAGGAGNGGSGTSGIVFVGYYGN